jgi:hypothetical protein
MGHGKIKKHIPLVFALIILIGFALFSDTGICIFRRVTGLPCPSCGMTRSYLALFAGDLKTAFFMHPLFWMVPIIAGMVAYSQYKKISFSKIYILIAVIFIVVYIIRMIILFPHTYPFDYEHSSLFGRIFFH